MEKKMILMLAGLCGAWSGYSLYHAAERGFPVGFGKLEDSLPMEGSVLCAVLGAIIFF
ncbi:hypothetical protein ACFSQ7_06110 [Paenibacillus rhizoplanae]